MESKRILQQCLTMYQGRLENLPKVMNQLYEVVKSDQVLQNLKDESMEKYRIGRVNEIVQDVMNSQKQRLLIRALQKCAQLNIKVKQMQQQENSSKSSKKQSYYEGLLEMKQKCDKQIASLNSLIEDKTKTIIKLNKQNSQLNAKIHEQKLTIINAQDCSKCQKLTKALNELKGELDLNKQFAQNLRKDGQTAIQSLTAKVQTLNEKNDQLQSEKQRRVALKAVQKQSKDDLNGRNDQARRNQKIQVIRKEMVYVQEQLIQVQKQFNMIKQFTVGQVLQDLKKVKNQYSKLKECLSKYQYQLAKDLTNLAQQIGHKLELFSLKKQQTVIRPEKILAKLNHIENQIDYFLQNQVLAD